MFNFFNSFSPLKLFCLFRFIKKILFLLSYRHHPNFIIYKYFGDNRYSFFKNHRGLGGIFPFILMGTFSSLALHLLHHVCSHFKLFLPFNFSPFNLFSPLFTTTTTNTNSRPTAATIGFTYVEKLFSYENVHIFSPFSQLLWIFSAFLNF